MCLSCFCLLIMKIPSFVLWFDIKNTVAKQDLMKKRPC